VTPAKVTDSQALSEVCPDGGVILKNNMKDKNRDKDRWLSAVRMPFEGVIARSNQRARYRGTAKNQFQALMQAFAYNIKRLTKIASGHIPLIEV
jgi:transposase, IS5 family